MSSSVFVKRSLNPVYHPQCPSVPQAKRTKRMVRETSNPLMANAGLIVAASQDGTRNSSSELCFSRALDQVKTVLSNQSSIRQSCQASSSNSISTNPSIKRADADYDDSEEPPLLIFDEGMCVYTETLPLCTSLGESLRSATLLYNVAQSCVVKKSYAEAIRWFELALVRLQLGVSNTSTATTATTSNTPTNTAAIDNALTTVRIHHNIGHCWYRMKRNNCALVSYQNALKVGQDANLGKLHLAAALNAIAVLLFHGKPDDAKQTLIMFQGSLEVYREILGNDTIEVATLLNNIGRVEDVNGNYKGALSSYGKALRLRIALLGRTSIDVAATICNMGHTHHQVGDLDKAISHYREFLKLAEDKLGRHRDLALIYKSMAEILHEKKDLDDAKAMYEKALEIGRGAFGARHPEVAAMCNKLGNVFYEMEQHDSALVYYNEGLAIERSVLESSHPYIMVTLCNIAQIHRHKGDFRAALTEYTALHKLQMAAYGSSSLESARTLSCMGLMKYQLKEFSESFDLYQEALRIQRDHFGEEDNAEVASSLNSIGLVLFNQGVFTLAKTCFTESLRVRLKILGPDHREVAILWYNIATIYLERGEDDTAIKLYKETLRVERNALGRTHHDVVLTLQHLGLVHQRRGELEEALKYFIEALDIEKSRGEKNRTAVAKLFNLIGNIHLQRASVTEMMVCYTEASRKYEASGEGRDSLVIAGYNFYGLSRLHPPCAQQA